MTTDTRSHGETATRTERRRGTRPAEEDRDAATSASASTAPTAEAPPRQTDAPARPAPAIEPSPSVEPAERPPARRRRSRRSLLQHGVIVLFAVGAVVAGFALALVPHERPLVGYLDGDREIVHTACGAAAFAAFEPGSEVLAADGTWASSPPCQRSAAFRLGLAGMLAAAGVATLAVVETRRRRGEVG